MPEDARSNGLLALGSPTMCSLPINHARQMEDALRMNGTEFTTVKWLKLCDSLTRSEAERFVAKIKREDAQTPHNGQLRQQFSSGDS